jgi:hypothetical protein
MLVWIAEAAGTRILPVARCQQHARCLETELENTMTRQSKISITRPLVVLCAFGFLSASSGLATAQTMAAADSCPEHCIGPPCYCDFQPTRNKKLVSPRGLPSWKTHGTNTGSALPQTKKYKGF